MANNNGKDARPPPCSGTSIKATSGQGTLLCGPGAWGHPASRRGEHVASAFGKEAAFSSTTGNAHVPQPEAPQTHILPLEHVPEGVSGFVMLLKCGKPEAHEQPFVWVRLRLLCLAHVLQRRKRVQPCLEAGEHAALRKRAAQLMRNCPPSQDVQRPLSLHSDNSQRSSPQTSTPVTVTEITEKLSSVSKHSRLRTSAMVRPGTFFF